MITCRYYFLTWYCAKTKVEQEGISMRTRFFSKLFIAIALLTSASLFAEAAETVTSYEQVNVKIEHPLKQNKMQDLGDIESMREQAEVRRVEMTETTTDRRFNGRQFRIGDKQ